MTNIVFLICAAVFIITLQVGIMKKAWTTQRLFWLPVVSFTPYGIALAVQAILEKRYGMIVIGVLIVEVTALSIGFILSKQMQQEPWRSKYQVKVTSKRRKKK